jgi:hypothetical protein
LEIILTVNFDGSSEIEVIGGDGKTCLDQTQALESALGIVEDRSLKPEYRQTVTQQQTRLKNRQ